MAMLWNDRLLPRERAYSLAGDWPVYLAGGGSSPIFLRCARCTQAVIELVPGGRVTLDGLTAAVVRHQVTAHNISLSGGGDGRGPDTAGPAAGDGSRDYRRAGDDPVVDRSEHQTAGGGRVPVAEAGGGQ